MTDSLRIIDSSISLDSRGFCDIQDITGDLKSLIHSNSVTSGLLTVIVPGSTAAITTIEFEPGAIQDLKRAIEQLAPQDIEYAHNLRWGDGNGFSHVRAALMRPSFSVPVIEGKLCLGVWQQVVFLDFDNKPRTRKLVVQIIGE